jgi:hypothetical protein
MAIETFSGTGTRVVAGAAEVCVLVWQTHASLFNDSV